jgi:hypothetical protein
MPNTQGESQITRLHKVSRNARYTGLFAMIAGAGLFIISFYTDDKSYSAGALTFVLGGTLFRVSESIRRILR